MDINERVVFLMDKLGLTSSIFADRLGVIRSSVSHVVSGRNKPGLDFLQKLMKTFPEVNPEWLMLGKGDAFKGQDLNSDSFKKERTDSDESNFRLKPEPKPEPAKAPQNFAFPRYTGIALNKPGSNGPTSQEPAESFHVKEKFSVLARKAQEFETQTIESLSEAKSAEPSGLSIKFSEPEHPAIIPPIKPAAIKRITVYFDDNSFQDFIPA